MGRALKGCRPYPLGADGPKKGAGRGVQPRSAKPRACLNRTGTSINHRQTPAGVFASEVDNFKSKMVKVKNNPFGLVYLVDVSVRFDEKKRT